MVTLKRNYQQRLVSSVASTIAYLAAISCALAQEEPEARCDSPTILSRASVEGRARTIVQYKVTQDPILAALGTDNEDIPAVTDRNRGAQNEILMDHFGQDQAAWEQPPLSANRMVIWPVFAINASTEDLRSLASDPRIDTCEVDEVGEPTLDQSVPLDRRQPQCAGRTAVKLR
jgi:hypothetical protein